MGTIYASRGKRIFDLVGACLGLFLASPLYAMLAILVKWKLGRPAIFAQERPGRDGKPFTIYKFRSMTNATDDNGALLPDSHRLTNFGSFLRRTSLDELPELWNVVRGDMSLVGPRPLLVRYVPYFSRRESLRLGVRPGVTGWAQVHGRNAVSWTDRLEYDVWYTENMSVLLDLKIIGMTLGRVLARDGMVVDPESMMRNLDDERRSGCP